MGLSLQIEVLGEPGARTGQGVGQNPDFQEGLASWGQKGCSFKL